MTNAEFGFFEGDVIVRWLKSESDSDREMELIEPFTYTDTKSVRWVADTGRRVDGASIPRAFWTLIGSPFVGDYRRASVLHDVACEDRTTSHRSVHYMFYEAMRCDNVPFIKAVLMFEAVRRFGPKWRVGRPFAQIPQPTVPNEQDVERLERAVESAIAEIGQDADVETIHKRVSTFITSG